jgi:hypothetical protein
VLVVVADLDVELPHAAHIINAPTANAVDICVIPARI